jgi:hypothetical protein
MIWASGARDANPNSDPILVLLAENRRHAIVANAARDE